MRSWVRWDSRYSPPGAASGAATAGLAPSSSSWQAYTLMLYPLVSMSPPSSSPLPLAGIADCAAARFSPRPPVPLLGSWLSGGARSRRDRRTPRPPVAPPSPTLCAQSRRARPSCTPGGPAGRGSRRPGGSAPRLLPVRPWQLAGNPRRPALVALVAPLSPVPSVCSTACGHPSVSKAKPGGLGEQCHPRRLAPVACGQEPVVEQPGAPERAGRPAVPTRLMAPGPDIPGVMAYNPCKRGGGTSGLLW
jgi:hypothetical protein